MRIEIRHAIDIHCASKTVDKNEGKSIEINVKNKKLNRMFYNNVL